MNQVNITITKVVAGVRGSRIEFTLGTSDAAKYAVPPSGVPLEGGNMLRVALAAYASTDKSATIEFAEPRGSGCCCSGKICIDYITKIWLPATSSSGGQ